MRSPPTEVVAPGDRAPGFALPNQHGELIDGVPASGHRGMALVFFPFAFSAVCTRELAGLQGFADAAAVGGVHLLAISCDPMFALRAFADAEGLSYDLLSDFWPHGAVARSYGVFDAERGCALRGTFLLDTAGVVRWRVLNELPVGRDIADLTAAIADLTA